MQHILSQSLQTSPISKVSEAMKVWSAYSPDIPVMNESRRSLLITTRVLWWSDLLATIVSSNESKLYDFSGKGVSRTL